MLYLQDHATRYKGLDLATIDHLNMEKAELNINGGKFCRILEVVRRLPYIPTTICATPFSIILTAGTYAEAQPVKFHETSYLVASPLLRYSQTLGGVYNFVRRALKTQPPSQLY